MRLWRSLFQMVEIRAELHGPGVYIAGEWVTCAISFTNTSEGEETIAWAGAQLHCQFCYREDIVRVDTALLPLPSPATDTAFVPNKGNILWSCTQTKQYIPYSSLLL